MAHKARPDFYAPILNVFHHNENICQILPTSPGTKKDAFKLLRPAANTCEEYHLSQTDIKMDGDTTNIHIQQTELTFTPLAEPVKPKRKRKMRYGSGGPPVWEFVDEKWRKEQDRLQILYKEQFRARVKMLRKSERLAQAASHNNLLKMVGPDWFQELSPKQMRTVDNLKSCILKDIQENTIINTQENIAALGLVLRPNHRHIKMALRECCQCPIEFLLVLYQLIDPNRKQYSINDRLLLSAVVHLSMESVLRELHVRIPSPPPPLKSGTKSIKAKKRLHYESPYLEPYTFERDPPRFTGVYYDKHIQRPESPYFAYLEEFRRVLNDAANALPSPEEASEDEILDELLYAQELYESLVEYRPVRVLLTPSKYVPCINFRNPKHDEPLAVVGSQIETPEIPKPIQQNVEQEAVQVETIAEVAEEQEREEPQQKEQEAEAVKENLDAGKQENEETRQPVVEKPFIETTVESPHICTADEIRGEKLRCERQKCDAKLEESTSESSSIDSANKICGCKAINKKFIKTPLCPCEKCEQDRQKKLQELSKVQQDETVVDYEETAEKADETSTKSVVECDCLEQYKKRIEQYETYQKRQKAVVQLKEQDHKYVITGVTWTKDGPVYIIQCVRPAVLCKCVYKAYEEEQDRIRLANAPKIPGGRIKYVISGVRATPNGNVFILSSAIPVEECDCMKIYQKYEERHHACNELYASYLNKMKNTINKYMESLLPSPEEKRMTLTSLRSDGGRKSVDNAAENPDEGTTTDEEYVERKDEATSSNQNTEVQTLGSSSSSEEDFPRAPCCQRASFQPKPCRGCGKRSSKPSPTIETIEEKPSQELENTESVRKSCCKPKKKKKCIGCYRPKPKPKRKPLPPCTCSIPRPYPPCIDCTCGVEEEEIVEEEIVEPPRVLKRFFIYKKLRCSERWQREVIEKALKSMADDEFPLAKLPDCHKLPHFKLWMQLRCGKFWTMPEKAQSVLTSKVLWRHTNICKRTVAIIHPKISKEDAKTLTWASADKCKKLANDAKDLYYRHVRQAMVDFGREFFPTTFSYEFPFKTFRDCYFAYTPSKEEDVLARDVWAVYEHK